MIEQNIFKTTAIYENRIRDKQELFNEMLLDEEGNAVTDFYTKKDLLICSGYTRIVYGDHGPYIEFEKTQVLHDNWKIKRSGYGYYNKLYPIDEIDILMYHQRKTVAGLPNPPPKNKRGFNGNREEGYADYRVGKYYISPWNKHLKIVKNNIIINNRKCNLSDIMGG